MNKKLIKKYFKEFEHWLNGGKLYAADKTKTPLDWLPLEPSWTSNDIIYVIDDEYLYLRKALAEGKIIQGEWKSCDGESTWLDTAEFTEYTNYRIKPDEPTFKVGDWVTRDYDKYIYLINSITRNEAEVFNGEHSVISLKSIKQLWKPQPGEWCVFWDDSYKESYVIKRFSHSDCQYYYPINTPNTCYQNIAPLEFVNTLKAK